MSLLVRTIACFLVAICMASMSFAASAHSVVVVDESAPHAGMLINEAPCPDCGTHESVGCGQTCSVAASDDRLEALHVLMLADMDLSPPRSATLRGTVPKPPITPPIA